jgi:hypothetical protein
MSLRYGCILDAFRYMAAGQRKVSAQRTYGVTNGAADRSSPDSSGSPQRCDAAAAS